MTFNPAIKELLLYDHKDLILLKTTVDQRRVSAQDAEVLIPSAYIKS